MMMQTERKIASSRSQRIIIAVVCGLLALVALTAGSTVSGQQVDSASTDADTRVLQPDTVRIEAVARDSASDTTKSDTAATGSQVTPKKSDNGDSLSEIRNLISIQKLVWTLILLILSYWINKFIVRILDTLSERITNYRLFIKRLVPMIRIGIWTFMLYIIIEGVINPPLQTLVTLTASIGLAVGFASQDILKNIFGGFMIILDRPFQVGDKIEIGSYYGEVQQIGLRSTRVVTPDDSVVSIPNSELVTKSVSNANSSALDCQVVAEIYLPATIDLPMVKELAYKAALSSKYVYLEKPIAVIALNEIHEEQFVVKLRVKAYVLDIRYEFPFKSDMTELLLESLNERGMIPGPVQSWRMASPGQQN
jgi:small-conductance mechanosensitive channel